MKVFYAELSANPAYYSFGYSVYGVLEPTDRLDDVYREGFLPFVGAKEQPGNMVYMARGTRVVVSGYTETAYHRRALKKLREVFRTEPEVTVYARNDFVVTETFVQFILSYFAFRFGKDAMSEERLRAMLDSGFITHISEYRSAEKPVGYLLEVHGETCMHLWYLAYAREHEDTCIGLYMYIDMLRRAKKEEMDYVYIGVTYGNWMKYKANFMPLEYFDGTSWVKDAKSEKLKKLLRTDASRVLGFVDAWRETKEPFYPAPYPFTSLFDEFRFLTVMMLGTPRVFFLSIIVIFLIALLFLAKLLV